MKHPPHIEYLTFRAKFIEGVVLFAEGDDGSGAKAMALLWAQRDAVFPEGEDTVKAVANLQDKLGIGNGLHFNVPSGGFNLFAGLHRISKGIGERCGQLRFIYRQQIGEIQNGGQVAAYEIRAILNKYVRSSIKKRKTCYNNIEKLYAAAGCAHMISY